MTVPLNVKAINACKGLITEHAAYFRMKQLRYQAMAGTQSCCEMGHRAGTDYMLRGTECSIEALCEITVCLYLQQQQPVRLTGTEEFVGASEK